MAWDFKNRPELPTSLFDIYYFESPHKQITEDFQAKVIEVHDGDTITLRVDFRNFDFQLRLLEIDAKELSEGGHEARDSLKKRIENEEVDILINKNRRVGKYGRLLGQVFSEGMDVGTEMLHLGLVTLFEQKGEGKVDFMETLEVKHGITAAS